VDGNYPKNIWKFFLPALACSAIVAHAQPAPTQDAEELRQRARREAEERQRQQQAPDVRLPRPETAPPERLPEQETPCFPIQRILLEGDSAERFQWALSAADLAGDGGKDPATARCLGTRGINLIIGRIQNAIIARGYITTRVLAAPQDLNTGTLRLTLLPGRIRQIRFAPDTSARANHWNAVPAKPGDLLNLRDIEQALENLKRVPTAEADIQIAPAEGPDARPGESDIVIAWKQAFPLRLTLAADDAGSRSTGKYQGSVTVSGDHLLTLNDLFYLSFNHDLGGGQSGDRGTRGGAMHYSLPIGYWQLGATISRNRYHQAVAGASQTYRYSGESENGEIKLSRLIYRDAVRKTTLALKGWWRNSQNYIDDTEIEVQRRRMAGWEFGAQHREHLGAALLDFNLAYKRGTGAKGSLAAPEQPFDEGTARPKMILADTQFNLPFQFGGHALRYTINWRAQWNRTPLVPQDRFAIGGRYTVRGFDGENLLSADRGWLLRNDLGWQLGQSGQELYLGIDHGRVGGQSAKFLIGRELTGAAIGLRGGYRQLNWDLFVGAPLDKPRGFQAPRRTAGFNFSFSY